MLKMITVIVSISLFTVGCSSEKETSWKEKNQISINSCIDRGYAYYDALGYGFGNYKLANGRMRNDEVRIRCERTAGAF